MLRGDQQRPERGRLGGNGGALYSDGNYASIVLCGDVIEDNAAGQGGFGGGVFFTSDNMTGTLTITDSTITGNTGGSWTNVSEGERDERGLGDRHEREEHHNHEFDGARGSVGARDARRRLRASRHARTMAGSNNFARAYPKDLAARVRASSPADARPLPAALERLLDVAYHASFLRDEERPVTCRVLVVPPSELPADAGPPASLLPLAFNRARAWDEDELRRLAPAADAHRALVGVEEREDGALSIWGIAQSGPRWLQVAQGGRQVEPPLPAALVIDVVRPGHLLVACGRLITELRGGRLSEATLDVFESKWMPARFADARALMASEHAEASRPSLPSATPPRSLATSRSRCSSAIVSTMRSAHHGGAIVGPPTCLAEDSLRAKYTFTDAVPRRRFRGLVLSILALVAEDAARTGRSAIDAYRANDDARIAELDEGLFEMGHLIASLTAVDGAVVLTKRFEILGFGAGIGNLPAIGEVRRALNLEAKRLVVERTDGVGTRRRSTYRLAAAARDALAIVVSQDGGTRFVADYEGSVTVLGSRARRGLRRRARVRARPGTPCRAAPAAPTPRLAPRARFCTYARC